MIVLLWLNTFAVSTSPALFFKNHVCFFLSSSKKNKNNSIVFNHNTTQHNTTQQNNTIQYKTIQNNTIQYNTTQHNTAKQNNTKQYNTIQYNTIQYNTKHKKIHTKDAITRVMYEVCEDAVKDGVRYMEVRFSPILHTRLGMSLSQVMEAICHGKLQLFFFSQKLFNHKKKKKRLKRIFFKKE